MSETSDVLLHEARQQINADYLLLKQLIESISSYPTAPNPSTEPEPEQEISSETRPPRRNKKTCFKGTTVTVTMTTNPYAKEYNNTLVDTTEKLRVCLHYLEELPDLYSNYIISETEGWRIENDPKLTDCVITLVTDINKLYHQKVTTFQQARKWYLYLVEQIYRSASPLGKHWSLLESYYRVAENRGILSNVTKFQSSHDFITEEHLEFILCQDKNGSHPAGLELIYQLLQRF